MDELHHYDAKVAAKEKAVRNIAWAVLLILVVAAAVVLLSI